jgi:hypothetical protein
MKCGVLQDVSTPSSWAEDCIRELKSLGNELEIVELEVKSHLKDDIKSVALKGPVEETISLPLHFKEHNFDFIINLSAKKFPSVWARSLPHGGWFYRFGSSDYDPGKFGSFEIFRGIRFQEVALEKVSEETATRIILKKGKLKVVLSSIKLHRRSVLSQVSTWPASVAKIVLASKECVLDLAETESLKEQKPLKRAGRMAIVPITAFRRCRMLGAKVVRSFTYQQWNIGRVTSNIRSVEHSQPVGVDWLLKPKWPDCYADPFLIQYQGKEYVFAERYDFLKRKGSIAVFPVDNGTTGEKGKADENVQTVMDLPFHVSYPCMLEHEARLYCIPETLFCEEIAIYRCEKFPRIWNKICVVEKGGRFADPTMFRHEKRWWLFATKFDEYSEGNASLYAWYSSDIRGPWQPHLRNPIKVDVTCSRSAGGVVKSRGQLLRPTQDCSRSYGEAIVINRIIVLTPGAFEERFYRRIIPPQEYPHACHHLANLGGTTLIDGRRDRFSFRAGISKVSHMLSQLESDLRSKQKRDKEIPSLVVRDLSVEAPNYFLR